MKNFVIFCCFLLIRQSYQAPAENVAAPRVINDSRVPQADKDIRMAYNKNLQQPQGQLDMSWPASMADQNKPVGAAIVSAVQIPAGSTIITPSQPTQEATLTENTGNNRQPDLSTYQQSNVPRVPQSSGQSMFGSDTSSLLRLLGSPSFISMMQPKTLAQHDAAQSLIPPLITDGMKHTLEQQQMTGGTSQQQQPQQFGMDPRTGLYSYPQTTGFGYPQMQPTYGMPASVPVQSFPTYPATSYNTLG